MENNLIIPPEVINPKAYKAMLAMKKHPALRNIMYLGSDGQEYNIAWFYNQLVERIKHLPPKEQEAILMMKTKYNQVLCKINQLHADAYGRRGRLGGKAKKTVVKERIAPFKNDIILLLGRMFTVEEVVKIMAEENNIEVTVEDVKAVLRDNFSLVEKEREEFRRRVADVRLYNKRPRLEELAWMFSKMKMRYITLNTTEAYNAMLRTLEQIRKESEGDIVNIRGAIDVNIEAEIQEHIQQEIYKTINIKEIILSRVAARMQYDPIKLITGLHNSYYAQFVDISGDFDPNAEMHYPSDSNYDFQKIEREATKATMDMSEEAVTPEQHSTAVNLKEIFLQKIKEQKNDLEKRVGVLNYMPTEDVDNEDILGEKPEKKRGRPRGASRILPSKNPNSNFRKGKEKVDYYTGEEIEEDEI